jgi:hypothetical protein
MNASGRKQATGAASNAAQRIGFYPQCLRKTRGIEQGGGIADKACWTEPLVTRAKLASSMGIVKWNAVATKVVQKHQGSRLNVSAGSAAVGRRVHGVKESAGGSKGGCQMAKICALNRRWQRPERAGQKSTVMRVAACR